MRPDANGAGAGRPTIAIVGGGFSGAALAYHLVERHVPARIVVFEPRARLGAGLAYDTAEPTSRINVPADKMSLIPGDDGHFARWIDRTSGVADDPEARTADGRLFVRRSLFGAYATAQLAPLLADGSVIHRQARVLAIEPTQGRWRIADDGGQTRLADVVVIATTHPPPTLPRELAGLAGDPRLIPDAQAPGWAEGIAAGDRVLVVGTGLTMADAIAVLERRGHRGSILAISRRGLLSRAHADTAAEPFGDFLSVPASTALELLRRARAAVTAAAAVGKPWHAVIDGLRAQGQSIWAGLAVRERRRLVRHLRPYWDVHRFRIAPMVGDAIDRLIDRQQLSVLAARLRSVDAGPDGIRVTLRPRNGSAPISAEVDRIIVTTGPGHVDVLRSQPALAALHAAGLLELDPVGLGIGCDRGGRILNHAGEPVPGLYLAGPLARGTFGELMGLPQVSDYADTLAETIVRALPELASAAPALAANA